MVITVTFPDSRQETFLSAQQASCPIGVFPLTILNAIKIGKNKIIRRRDKAEFQIEAKDYPRMLSEKQKHIFRFLLTLFLLRLLKMIQPLLTGNRDVFLTIIEHNIKPFPRKEEEKPQVLLQKTI